MNTLLRNAAKVGQLAFPLCTSRLVFFPLDATLIFKDMISAQGKYHQSTFGGSVFWQGPIKQLELCTGCSTRNAVGLQKTITLVIFIASAAV